MWHCVPALIIGSLQPVAAYDATVSREFYAGLGISNLEAESLEASLAEAEV